MAMSSAAQALRESRLSAALLGLPGPWTILRNLSASRIDGPPWAKFVALHAEKGIALVDLEPYRPEFGISPLAAFLTSAKLAPLDGADLSIISLAVEAADIPYVGDHLIAAFDTITASKVAPAGWAEAVADFLVDAPDLCLTCLLSHANHARASTAAADAPTPTLAAAEETPPQTAPRGAAAPQPGRTHFHVRADADIAAEKLDPAAWALREARLSVVLATLPEPWIVLRDFRPPETDGPPWVRFMALHPEKGIALVDIAPRRPEIATTPLAKFLSRANISALTAALPPILPVTIDAAEIPSAGNYLGAAFAGAPPPEIENPAWTAAVADALIATRGLSLRILTRGNGTNAIHPARPPNPAVTSRTEARPRRRRVEPSWLVAACLLLAIGGAAALYSWPSSVLRFPATQLAQRLAPAINARSPAAEPERRERHLAAAVPRTTNLPPARAMISPLVVPLAAPPQPHRATATAPSARQMLAQAKVDLAPAPILPQPPPQKPALTPQMLAKAEVRNLPASSFSAAAVSRPDAKPRQIPSRPSPRILAKVMPRAPLPTPPPRKPVLRRPVHSNEAMAAHLAKNRVRPRHDIGPPRKAATGFEPHRPARLIARNETPLARQHDLAVRKPPPPKQTPRPAVKVAATKAPIEVASATPRCEPYVSTVNYTGAAVRVHGFACHDSSGRWWLMNQHAE